LEQVRDEIGIPAEVRLIVADASDPASIDAMVSRTHVVLTTVGPYQLYGSDLVRACAEASGARIVFSCGFDSVPFDLGVYFLQQAAKQQLSAPVARIKGRVRVMKGTFSGGTLASFKATMAAAMGTQLIERLQQNAGLTFELENS
jgi:short subunit dehydrogenase-like uncharacterized protein